MKDKKNLLLEAILLSLEDARARDIVCIDVQGKSDFADFIFIVSGSSSRHVASIADHLLRKILETRHEKARLEGSPGASWLLIDAGDVIIHIFIPETRQFYEIEKIWNNSQKIETSPPLSINSSLLLTQGSGSGQATKT